MTITLSAELCAPKDIHTARQTNTLQRTPRKNNWIVGKAALVDAMTSAVLPTAPPPNPYCPAKNTYAAVPIAPTILPT